MVRFFYVTKLPLLYTPSRKTLKTLVQSAAPELCCATSCYARAEGERREGGGRGRGRVAQGSKQVHVHGAPPHTLLTSDRHNLCEKANRTVTSLFLQNLMANTETVNCIDAKYICTLSLV